MIKTLSVTTMSALLILIACLSIVTLFNLSSFMEGFNNGFTLSQTPFETVANFTGNIVWEVIK